MGCGALNKKECDQRTFIDSNFDTKKVFLDIPYLKEYSRQEKILEKVLTVAGLKPVIAKDKITSNDKLCKICRLLQTCRYGIADISFNRHSVSYELGLLHAFGLSTCILLGDNKQKFGDIDGLEHQSYAGTCSLRIAVAKWLLENAVDADKTNLDKLVKANNKFLTRETKFIRKVSVDNQNLSTRLQMFRNFLDLQIERLEEFAATDKPDACNWPLAQMV